MGRAALVFVFFLTIAGRPLSAQRLAPTPFASFAPPRLAGEVARTPIPQLRDPSPEPDISGPILGGLVGGAIGFVGGFIVGGKLGGGGTCGDDWCGLEEAIYGSFVGEMLLLPVGVHIGNRGRGNFAADFGTSVGSGVGGVLFLAPVGEGKGLILAGALQLIGTVAIERSTGRRR